MSSTVASSLCVVTFDKCKCEKIDSFSDIFFSSFSFLGGGGEGALLF